MLTTKGACLSTEKAHLDTNSAPYIKVTMKLELIGLVEAEVEQAGQPSQGPFWSYSSRFLGARARCPSRLHRSPLRT